MERDQAEFEAEQRTKVANVRAAREREVAEFKLAQDEAARLAEAMAGAPYDRALDRARRLVNERRFALGVQLIAGHR